MGFFNGGQMQGNNPMFQQLLQQMQGGNMMGPPGMMQQPGMGMPQPPQNPAPQMSMAQPHPGAQTPAAPPPPPGTAQPGFFGQMAQNPKDMASGLSSLKTLGGAAADIPGLIGTMGTEAAGPMLSGAAGYGTGTGLLGSLGGLFGGAGTAAGAAGGAGGLSAMLPFLLL